MLQHGAIPKGVEIYEIDGPFLLRRGGEVQGNDRFDRAAARGSDFAHAEGWAARRDSDRADSTSSRRKDGVRARR